MKRLSLVLIIILGAILLINSSAFSYWVWTPETKKFVNPKYAVRDTPKEQFEYAQVFLDKKDYKKAVFEFEKLVKSYPNSEFAPKAQYYIGRAYEEEGDLYKAFLNYQKVIDNYPYNDKVEEIIEREYKIGNLFFSGKKSRLLGMDVVPGIDKASEVFQKVVTNAPYGEYADIAQFRLAEAYKKLGNSNEAIVQYQKLVDEYPSSKLIDEARYQIAQCAYDASLGADYDQETTDKAISEFKDFAQTYPQSEIAKGVDETLKKLREKKAFATLKTAEFYRRLNKVSSALIYYQEVIDEYPETSVAKDAKAAIDEINYKKTSKAPQAKATKKPAPAQTEEISPEAKTQQESSISAEAEKLKDVLAEVPKETTKEKSEENKIEPPKESPKEEPAGKASQEKLKKEVAPEKPNKVIAEAPQKEVGESEVLEASKPKEAKRESAEQAMEALKPPQKLASAKEPKKPGAFNLFGYTAGSLLPSNIKTIYVDNFVNKINVTEEVSDVNAYRVYRARLEADITNEVNGEFRRDGNLHLMQKGEADLELYGELIDLNREPLRYDTNNNIEEFRVKIIANLILKNQDGEVEWQETGFTGEGTYAVTGPLTRSEDDAIDEAINDLAKRIVERTIENW